MSFQNENHPSSFIILQAVTDLYSRVTDLSEFVNRMDILSRETGTTVSSYGQTSYRNLFTLFLRGTLHSQLPIYFEDPIKCFYSRTLHVFHSRKNVSVSHSGN